MTAMTTKTINTSNGNIVVVDTDAPIISDGQSALDFIMNIGYEHNCPEWYVRLNCFVEREGLH